MIVPKAYVLPLPQAMQVSKAFQPDIKTCLRKKTTHKEQYYVTGRTKSFEK